MFSVKQPFVAFYLHLEFLLYCELLAVLLYCSSRMNQLIIIYKEEKTNSFAFKNMNVQSAARAAVVREAAAAEGTVAVGLVSWHRYGSDS